MSSRKTIVFLGAPTSAEAMKSWHPPPSPHTHTTALPPFQIDTDQRTQGPTWRRLTDPIDSLSQDLSQTRILPRWSSDPFLERSLQIYDDELENSDAEEMDTTFLDLSEYSSLLISPNCSPFLTGYDFDVNEITELEEIPVAGKVSSRMSVSFVVAVREVGRRETVMTRFGRSIELVKVIVGDQTRERFEIVCWDSIATLTQSLRVNDIVHFRGTPIPPIILVLQTHSLFGFLPIVFVGSMYLEPLCLRASLTSRPWIIRVQRRRLRSHKT
jgi:hypothetical protein